MIIELLLAFNFLLSMIAFGYILYMLVKKQHDYDYMEERFEEAVTRNENKANRAIELYFNSLRIGLENLLDDINSKSTKELREMERLLKNMTEEQGVMSSTMTELMSINKAQARELEKKNSLIRRHKKKEDKGN